LKSIIVIQDYDISLGIFYLSWGGGFWIKKRVAREDSRVQRRYFYSFEGYGCLIAQGK